MMGDGPILVIPVLLRFADLTTQQTIQVRRIIERSRTDTQGFLSQLADANNQLDSALLAPTGGRERESALMVQRLAQLRLQFMQSELKTALAIRRILTPEQLGKVILIRYQDETNHGILAAWEDRGGSRWGW